MRNEDGGLLAPLSRPESEQAVDCAEKRGSINSLHPERWQFGRLTP